MEFSEYQRAWSTVPHWVRFLIDFGYGWPWDEERPRRIALVSMPCDSAGAGLVALGAMVRGMANPNANDLDGHFGALKRYARQYLESCRTCEMRCRPQLRGCGYNSEANGRVRYKGGHVYTLSERSDLTKGDVWLFRQGVDRWLNPRFSIDWQIDGEPLPQSINDMGGLPPQVFSVIVEAAQIIPDNLRRSYSGICFAGRAAGKSATRDTCASIRFRVGANEYSLPELLTVRGWHQEHKVSRLIFFNARTQEIDRVTYAPTLVVADGDASFLRLLDRSEFQRCDVIGIVQRTVERDSLESVGNRMLGLRQWYDEDDEQMEQLATIPQGISIAILRRRTR